MRQPVIVALLVASLATSAAAEEGGIFAAGWTSDGKYLVTVGGERRVRVHDAATGLVLKAVTAPGEPTVFVSFSPDSGYDESNSLSDLAVSGAYALTSGSDRSLHWWTVPDLQVALVDSTSYDLVGLTLSASGKLAAYTETSTRYLTSGMELLRWTEEGAVRSSFSSLPPPDSSDSFGVPVLSPDGNWAMADTGSFLQLWDLSDAEMPSRELPGITSRVLAMSNTHFFTLSGDDGISMRTYYDPEVEVRRFVCPGAQALAVDAAETRLVAQADGEIISWDLGSPSEPTKWGIKASGMTLSADGKQIALWQEEALEVWRLDDPGTLLYRLPLNTELEEAAAP